MKRVLILNYEFPPLGGGAGFIGSAVITNQKRFN